MNVEQIMTKSLALCTPSMNIKDCANLMVEYDCGEIPVVESQENPKLLGVITDRDITCRVVAKGVEPSKAQVENYMTTNIFTVKKDEDLQKCQQIMSKNQVRRLPVVDDEMKCIGLISQANIARSESEENAGELVKNISQSRSTKGRNSTQNLINH